MYLCCSFFYLYKCVYKLPASLANARQFVKQLADNWYVLTIVISNRVIGNYVWQDENTIIRLIKRTIQNVLDFKVTVISIASQQVHEIPSKSPKNLELKPLVH